MKFVRLAFVLLVGILLSGCLTTDLVPKDYSGPTAVIADSSGDVVKSSAPWFSAKRLVEPQKSDLFYVFKIDDKPIENIASKTEARGQNSGFRLKLYPVERKVLIKPMKVILVGKTYYAAPIGEMFNEVYTVSGTVDFTPNANEKYVVRGVLGKDYSAVWIETEDGRVVTTKIEKHG